MVCCQPHGWPTVCVLPTFVVPPYTLLLVPGPPSVAQPFHMLSSLGAFSFYSCTCRCLCSASSCICLFLLLWSQTQCHPESEVPPDCPKQGVFCLSSQPVCILFVSLYISFLVISSVSSIVQIHIFQLYSCAFLYITVFIFYPISIWWLKTINTCHLTVSGSIAWGFIRWQSRCGLKVWLGKGPHSGLSVPCLVNPWTENLGLLLAIVGSHLVMDCGWAQFLAAWNISTWLLVSF